MAENCDVDSGDKALVLLQSLICYLREKNVLSRADLEELRVRMETRLSSPDNGMACEIQSAQAAALEMQELDEYCGRKYGGKHRRTVN